MIPQNIECCGVVWKSPFCGNCGQQLRDASPMDSLAKHCAKKLKGYRTELERTERQLDKLAEDAEQRYELEKIRDSKEASVRRWKSWVDAIRDALAKDGLAQ